LRSCAMTRQLAATPSSLLTENVTVVWSSETTSYPPTLTRSWGPDRFQAKTIAVAATRAATPTIAKIVTRFRDACARRPYRSSSGLVGALVTVCETSPEREEHRGDHPVRGTSAAGSACPP